MTAAASLGWPRTLVLSLLVFVPAGLVGVWPAAFLWFSVWNFGCQYSWWAGDPTWNEGPGPALMLAVISAMLLTIVLVGAGLLAWLLSRHNRVTALRMWAIAVVLYSAAAVAYSIWPIG